MSSPAPFVATAHLQTSSEAIVRLVAHESSELAQHPVLEAVSSEAALRVFMRSHVYTVWTHISLVKRLQHELSNMAVPWVPPRSRLAARLINELVTGVECDLDTDGMPISHYELYLDAMTDVTADSQSVRRFVQLVDDGSASALDKAFDAASTPQHVRAYVRHALRVARQGSLAQVLGCFLHGRDISLQQSITRLLAEWTRTSPALPRLAYYLERHSQLECGRHADRLQRVVQELDSTSPRFADDVLASARESLGTRIRFWDGVLAEIRHSAAPLAGPRVGE